MNKVFKFLIWIFIIGLLISASFYFKKDLVDFYLRLNEKILQIEKISLNFARQIEEQISVPPPLRVQTDEALGNLTRAGVIALTNSERAKQGLLALSENVKLNAAAMAKAQDMLKNQYFEHVSPLGAGPAELAKNAGYDFIAFGENLAMGDFKDDADLVGAWMASPGHRENILNSKYREIGVAVIKGNYQGRMVWMAVQEFGLSFWACAQPDKNLKEQIDFYENQALQLLQEINTKRAEIEKIQFANRKEYNQAINQYNEMVSLYNEQAVKTKKLINDYNVQVNAFNLCVK